MLPSFYCCHLFLRRFRRKWANGSFFMLPRRFKLQMSTKHTQQLFICKQTRHKWTMVSIEPSLIKPTRLLETILTIKSTWAFAKCCCHTITSTFCPPLLVVNCPWQSAKLYIWASTYWYAWMKSKETAGIIAIY